MNPETLKSIDVLREFDDAALARLAAVVEEQDFPEGRTISGEGDPGDAMFFILSGSVRIEKKTGEGGTGQKTLAILETGDYFGEISLFDQQPRSASAVAAGPSQILRLSKSAFDSLRQEGTRMLFAMIRTSGERIRLLNSHVVVYDEIGKAIGESRDLEQLLGVVLRQLCQATTADWGMVVLRAQFSNNVELRSAVGLDLTPAQKEAIAAGQGFLGAALHQPREQLVRDFESESAFQSCTRLGFETVALLLAPILIEARVLGLIVLGGREPGQFDVNDLNLARGVARQAAQSILNARHREEDAARSRHAKQFVRF
jgi:CRP-like cAMP-binding protein